MTKEFQQVMHDFVQPSPTSLIESIRRSKHSNTQAMLAGFDATEKERLLAQALELNPTPIPNSQELASYLSRVSEIDWFQPTNEPIIGEVEDCLDDLYERIGIARPPTIFFKDLNDANNFKNQTRTENDWRNAWESTARDADRLVSRDLPRHTVYQVVRQAGLAVSLPATQYPNMGVDGQRRAAGGAQWFVVKDLIGRKNPFEPLVDLFQMGLWPIGHVQDEAFGIYVPKPNK